MLLFQENYPAGAADRSDAPWNDNRQYSTTIKPKTREYSVLAIYPDQLAILQDAAGKKYAFFFNALDKSDFAPYAEREIEHAEKDEDGDMSFDYSDNWEITDDVIEKYVNDNISSMSKGVGMEAWENGVDIVEIDDALRAELLDVFGKNQSIAEVLSGINEDKEVYYPGRETNPVRGKNFELIKSFAGQLNDYVQKEIPDYYLKEVGIKVILDFLSVEDGMNFRLQAGLSTPGTTIFKDAGPRQDNESEIDYILRKNKIPYKWDDIRSRLAQYFVRRLVANIPTDRELSSFEDVKKFVKTYEQAFMYDYMIPMSKHAK